MSRRWAAVVVCGMAGLLLAGCARAPRPAPRGAPVQPRVEMPVIEGDWWRIARPPDLGAYASDKAQVVDFSIWQAADGTWQMVACVRYTKFPGGTRLLYRWETARLTDPDWQERGIFLTSDAHPDHEPGSLRAPHVVRDGGRYIMFYDSGGWAFALTSDDGKQFRQMPGHDGQARLFELGRDVMLFDNRARDGRWHAYYTWIKKPDHVSRQNHTIGVRTATSLAGPWSAPTDLGVNTADNPDPKESPYNFINAESPFVLFRNGLYYRWEQMKVFASPDLSRWPDPEVTTLTATSPRAFYAPEIITDAQGAFFIAGYKYKNDRRGLYMARLRWR